MLPYQLLRARRRGDRLVILWARGTSEELELAEAVLEAYSPGRRLSEVRADVEELEDLAPGADGYKLVRGLALLVERRCELASPPTAVPPERAREAVFRVVNERFGGFAAGEEREEAIRAAADELGVDPRELEEALWADSEGEVTVRSVDRPDPRDLLREYNLSLLQTALFRCVRLRVETSSGDVKGLLRAVRRLGLMYVASREGDRLVLDVDGPSTVLKMTTRYGTALARLVPHVVSMRDWALEARVVRRYGAAGAGGRRRVELTLRVDSSRADLFPRAATEPPPYDSRLEEEFASVCAGDGWRVTREPGPLLAGRSVMIPDFLLEKGPVRVYVEVMGFWTPEYVRRKLEKLSEVREPVLVAVRRDLMCSRVGEAAAGGVVTFDGRRDAPALLAKLRELEARIWSEARRRLRVDPGEVTGGRRVIGLAEAARGLGLTVDQLLEAVEFPGYAVLGGYLVSEDAVAEVRSEAASRRPRTLGEMRGIVEGLGLPGDLAAALAEAIGYRVVWRSLDEDEAELVPEGAG